MPTVKAKSVQALSSAEQKNIGKQYLEKAKKMKDEEKEKANR